MVLPGGGALKPQESITPVRLVIPEMRCPATGDCAGGCQPRPSLERLLRVGRLGVRVAVEIPVKPVELPVETLDEVLGLAGAREVVVLARKEDQL